MTSKQSFYRDMIVESDWLVTAGGFAERILKLIQIDDKVIVLTDVLSSATDFALKKADIHYIQQLNTHKYKIETTRGVYYLLKI